MDEFVEQSTCLDCCNNLLKADASVALQLLVFLGAPGKVRHDEPSRLGAKILQVCLDYVNTRRGVQQVGG